MFFLHLTEHAWRRGKQKENVNVCGGVRIVTGELVGKMSTGIYKNLVK